MLIYPRLRRSALLAAALLLLSVSGAFALDAINKSFFGGVAIRGYDPVAYFTEGKPVEGNDDIAFDWMEATWHFATEQNRDLFAEAPAKYAPQYGGYCAYAVALGGTASIDPDAWKIVDDKLYLNNSLSVQKTWEKDVPGYIRKADRNWPGIVAK